MASMSLREKVAQLSGVWVGVAATGADVAPQQHELAALPAPWEDLVAAGIGQLTRPFGSAPVDPVAGAQALAETQRTIMAASRWAIPALVHEECLTGLAAWRASVYPSPLCWGASFDPALVEQMGAQIGATMRRLGIHQGLAPVLDVTRDLRWGRVEETIGEDPFLVGTIGSAYVAGVQSAGVVATLKHFVGLLRLARRAATWPRCRSARASSPTCCCRRSRWRCVPGPRSVMNSYNDLDGVPVGGRPPLLTELLRDGSASPARWSPTTSRSPSCRPCTAWPSGPRPPGSRCRGDRRGTAPVECYGEPLLDAVEAGEVEVRWWTAPWRGCCGRSASSGCWTRTGPRTPGASDAATSDRGPRPGRAP